MSNILVVEDEEKIARFIELELEHEGYSVTKVYDGRSGVEAACTHDFDLILLDIMLPELNGLEVLRRIRRESDVPVIMLTARDAVMDKVAGLDAGADDYITKPFAIEELLARVRVALKRHGADSTPDKTSVHQQDITTNPENSLVAGVVTCNPLRHEVRVNNELVDLTAREFEVLRVLLENKGIVMSRDRLAQLALGYDYMGETNIIDVYIRHLRAKIDDHFDIKLISTVRGVGYVIRD